MTNLLSNDDIDYFIHAMAVSDYTVDYVTNLNELKNSIINYNNLENIKKYSDSKISSTENDLVIVLKKTPKIISIIKNISPNTHLIGFKLLDSVSEEKLIMVAKNLKENSALYDILLQYNSGFSHDISLIKGEDKDDILGICELISKKTRTGSFKGSTHELLKIIH